MKLLKNNWPIIVLTISSIAIISALTVEYLFNILPCKMCLYQRYPFYLIIFISIIYLFSKKIPLIWYYWICALSFSFGLFFAIWHVGIEQKILPSLQGCSNTIHNTQSIAKLQEQIINQNIVNCDEITWSIMGLSAATLNSLLLIVLLVINSNFIIQHFYDKEN